jgi:hypothetical protein
VVVLIVVVNGSGSIGRVSKVAPALCYRWQVDMVVMLLGNVRVAGLWGVGREASKCSRASGRRRVVAHGQVKVVCRKVSVGVGAGHHHGGRCSVLASWGQAVTLLLG